MMKASSCLKVIGILVGGCMGAGGLLCGCGEESSSAANVVGKSAQPVVVAAPDSVAGKVFVLLVEQVGETSINEVETPKPICSADAFTPSSYWQEVRWQPPAADDYCRLRELKWQPHQPNPFSREWEDDEFINYEWQSYKRVGQREAVLFDSSECTFQGAATTAARRWFKYELHFETPTQGSFRGFDGAKYCNVNQIIGHFWLRDIPSPPQKTESISNP